MNIVNDNNRNIAKAIYNIRKDNHLSQEQFAEKVGVTRQAVSRWEMGVSAPNIATLVSIGEKFGVSMDLILRDADSSKKSPVLFSTKKTGIVFIILGLLNLVSLPFLADLRQSRNMVLYKSAYEHSYLYICEYPLLILLIVALLLLCVGAYILLSKRS